METLRTQQDWLDRMHADEMVVASCQGNLIRSYNMAMLRHLVVRVEDAAAARQFLVDVTDETSDGPQITTGANWERRAKPPLDQGGPLCLITEMEWDEDLAQRRSPTADMWDGKPATCLNVGITAKGLTALGLDETSYLTFPEEFRQGAIGRATKVGDVDGSHPKLWRDGFDDEDKVHLMWTVHSGTQANLDAACTDLIERWDTSGAFSVTSQLDGAKLPDADGNPTHDVHFGYRDDISQPRFELWRNGAGRTTSFHVPYESGPVEELVGEFDRQPAVPLGALLQDQDGLTSFDNVQWQQPALVSADGKKNYELSRYGCYNAFRVMEQDVHTFETFLETESKKLGWNKEFLAAKLMGRWRSGVPIVQTPDYEYWSQEDLPEMPDPDITTLNDFDYAADYVAEVKDLGQVTSADGLDEISGMVAHASREGVNDPDGAVCPLGSHIRRSNPRRGNIVQRSANHTRQLVRRGMPYGPPYDPKKPHDGEPRGLLGSFFCGSLLSQFESMMYDWINLGLLDPRISGTNCPIVGANDPASSWFDIPIQADPAYPDRPTKVTIRGFPRFVETVGAAYLFYPGVRGLQLLGTLNERSE